MKSYPPPLAHAVPPIAWITLAIAVICLSVGVGLALWVARRNFYRNNAAGIQEFDGFRSAVWCGIVEGLARLVAGFCLVGGVLAGLAALLMLIPF